MEQLTAQEGFSQQTDPDLRSRRLKRQNVREKLNSLGLASSHSLDLPANGKSNSREKGSLSGRPSPNLLQSNRQELRKRPSVQKLVIESRFVPDGSLSKDSKQKRHIANVAGPLPPATPQNSAGQSWLAGSRGAQTLQGYNLDRVKKQTYRPLGLQYKASDSVLNRTNRYYYEERNSRQPEGYRDRRPAVTPSSALPERSGRQTQLYRERRPIATPVVHLDRPTRATEDYHDRHLPNMTHQRSGLKPQYKVNNPLATAQNLLSQNQRHRAYNPKTNVSLHYDYKYATITPSLKSAQYQQGRSFAQPSDSRFGNHKSFQGSPLFTRAKQLQVGQLQPGFHPLDYEPTYKLAKQMPMVTQSVVEKGPQLELRHSLERRQSRERQMRIKDIVIHSFKDEEEMPHNHMLDLLKSMSRDDPSVRMSFHGHQSLR